jgi:hypothetical protein
MFTGMSLLSVALAFVDGFMFTGSVARFAEKLRCYCPNCHV